ncbi:MAG: SPFH domain-containing protein [Polyangiaceae bacterium]|nr:SPFH domain-containing protein [Polyangiaceae bacterium]
MTSPTSAIDSSNMSPEIAMAMGLAVGVILLFAVIATVSKSLLFICAPNEILVFSGRKRRLADGTNVGFKVIHGGRAFRIPLLETVARMDVRLYGVVLTVSNVFSKGGIPLNVHAIANVKVSTDPRFVHHAVERFLGVATPQILTVARQTLEGVLREVVSQLTPEEVNQDRLKFAQTLINNTKDDFDKLGLELDVLKIQNVSDDQKYLDNLGRAQIANMLRDAENAENAALQEQAQAQALARQLAESATQQAEAQLLQKKNAFRAEIAKLEAEAKSIENEAEIVAKTAQATAEQELQALRADLAKLTLHVDTVLPAEANARASAARARGEAAPTIENGKAAAEALSLVANEWTNAGSAGRDVYVLQQLDAIVVAAIQRVRDLHIEALEVVDGGNAESVASVLAAFPRSVTRVVEEIGQAIGVDVHSLVTPLTPQAPNSEKGAK